MKKISLLVLAILLIPAMGWGEEKPGWYGQGPRPPALTREMIKAHTPNLDIPTKKAIKPPAIPQYEFKRVNYSKTGSKWTEAKEMALITKYVNQALRENPGWVFFQFEYWVYPKFEIIIYLQREVSE